MQPMSLAAQNNPNRSFIIRLGIIPLPAFIKPNQPIPSLFHLLHSPHKIFHPHHGQMFQRPSRSPRNAIREPRRPPLRNHHPRSPSRKRSPHNRAQILRILHAVKQHNQRPFGFRRQQILQLHSRPRSRQRNHALMLPRPSQPINLRAVLKSHRHPPLPRPPHNRLHAVPVPPASNHNPIKRTPSLQRLLHSMNAQKVAHSF